MFLTTGASRKFILLCACFFLLLGAGVFFVIRHGHKSAQDPREKGRVADQASIDQILALDRGDNNSVFVFTKDYPQFRALRNKRIILKPLDKDLKINYDEYVHKAYMGPIYILLPAYYTGIRASVIMKCFPAYKGFKLKDVSDEYVLYYASQRR